MATPIVNRGLGVFAEAGGLETNLAVETGSKPKGKVMANEMQKAAEIDALIKKDADEKEAKAKADAAMGENLDKMLGALDSISKRMDAWEADAKARKDAEEAAEKEKSDPKDVVADKAKKDGDFAPDQPKEGAPVERLDSMKLHDICLDEQYQADKVYNNLGLGRSPAPVHGTSYRDYAVRLLDPLLKHSKAWKGIKTDSLRAMDDASFQVVKAQIYADSDAASRIRGGEGDMNEPLREVRHTDEAGRVITEFHGARSFIHDFAGPRKYIAKINNSDRSGNA